MRTSARKTDRSTSHEAAEQVEHSGRAAGQRQACLLAVWKTPGKTAAEIAVDIGVERHVPSRRLPELRKERQVKTGLIRRCTVTGNPSMTWWPLSGSDAQSPLPQESPQ